MTAPANMLDLAPDIIVALEEVERYVAEASAAATRVGELEARVAELAHRYPKEAANAGVQVATTIYRNTNASLFVSAKFGLAAFALASAAGTVGYLKGIWDQWRCQSQLAALLKEKQAFARERLAFIQRLQPMLQRVHEKLTGAVQREAATLLPLDRYHLGGEILRNLDALFSSLVRSTMGVQTLNYIEQQMSAWLSGRHSSGAIAPDAGLAYLDAVDLVLRVGPAADDKSVELLVRANLGRTFLIREGTVRTLRRIDGEHSFRARLLKAPLNALAREIANQRIRGWIVFWSDRGRIFKEFDKGLLRGSVDVSRQVRQVVAFASLSIIVLAGAGAGGPPLAKVLGTLDAADACELPGTDWAVRVIGAAFKSEFDLRAKRCMDARYSSACSALAKGVVDDALFRSARMDLNDTQMEFLQRVLSTEGELEPADLQLSRELLPCAGMPAMDEVWRRAMGKAARSASAWEKAPAVSSDFVLLEPETTAQVRSVLARRSAELASRALKAKNGDLLHENARIFCLAAAAVHAEGRACARLGNAR